MFPEQAGPGRPRHPASPGLLGPRPSSRGVRARGGPFLCVVPATWGPRHTWVPHTCVPHTWAPSPPGHACKPESGEPPQTWVAEGGSCWRAPESYWLTLRPELAPLITPLPAPRETQTSGPNFSSCALRPSFPAGNIQGAVLRTERGPKTSPRFSSRWEKEGRFSEQYPRPPRASSFVIPAPAASLHPLLAPAARLPPTPVCWGTLSGGRS